MNVTRCKARCMTLGVIAVVALATWACKAKGTTPAGASVDANLAQKPVEPTAPSAPGAAGAVTLDPQQGIGPIHLGMSFADIAKLGLPVTRGAMGKFDVRVGPYRVMFYGGQVGFIEVELQDLPAGIVVGGTTVTPDEKDIEKIAKLLSDCGALQVAVGGNSIVCEGKRVWVKSGGPVGIVGFHVTDPVHEAQSSDEVSDDQLKQMAAPGASSAVTLDPQQGIGPVHLGMSFADIAKLGLPVTRGAMGKSDVRVGPYRVMFYGGQVGFVEVELKDLPAGIVIGGTAVTPDEKDIEKIAKQLSDCGSLQVAEGGNSIVCEGRRVWVKIGGPVGIVEFHVTDPVHEAQSSDDVSDDQLKQMGAQP